MFDYQFSLPWASPLGIQDKSYLKCELILTLGGRGCLSILANLVSCHSNGAAGLKPLSSLTLAVKFTCAIWLI